jgi:hypothetical protein
MACLNSRSILNPKFLPNKKNEGNPPPLTDYRQKYINTECGYCSECLKKKANNWRVRLVEHTKQNKNGFPITLTFSDESIFELSQKIRIIRPLEGYELSNAIATLAVKLFRDRYEKKFKKSLPHFLITEIGHNGTNNIHLHGIFFSDCTFSEIAALWKYGFIHSGKRTNNPKYSNSDFHYVNGATITYLLKYFTKKDFKNKTYTPKVFASKNLGANFFSSQNVSRNKFKGSQTNLTYVMPNGTKTILPRAFVQKLYTDDQRTALASAYLNQGITYVGGNKIKDTDTEQGQNYLQEAIKQAKSKDLRLGYVKPSNNIELRAYENRLHNEKIKIRLERAQKKNALKKQNYPTTPQKDSSPLKKIPMFDPQNPKKLYRRKPLIIPPDDTMYRETIKDKDNLGLALIQYEDLNKLLW